MNLVEFVTGLDRASPAYRGPTSAGSISEPSFYAWKKKYAGMGILEMRRVKQLEDENRRLKGLV